MKNFIRRRVLARNMENICIKGVAEYDRLCEIVS
jgi:hypothetical protein